MIFLVFLLFIVKADFYKGKFSGKNQVNFDVELLNENQYPNFDSVIYELEPLQFKNCSVQNKKSDRTAFYFVIGDQCDFSQMIYQIKKLKPKLVIFFNDSQDIIYKKDIPIKYPIFEIKSNIDFSNHENFYINIFKDKQRKMQIYYFYQFQLESDFQMFQIIKKILKELQEYIYFEPVIFTFDQDETDKSQNKDCIFQGKYCSLRRDDFLNISGNIVLQELLREKCLYMYQKNLFFDYLNKFKKNCLYSFHEYCSNKILENFDIDSKYISNCFNNSFQAIKSQKHKTIVDNKYYYYKNKVLKHDRNIQEYYQIKSASTILIGSEIYYVFQKGWN